MLIEISRVSNVGILAIHDAALPVLVLQFGSKHSVHYASQHALLAFQWCAPLL